MRLWIYQGEGFKIYNLTMRCNCVDHSTHSYAHYFGDEAPREIIAIKLWYMRKELRRFTKIEEARDGH